MSGLQWMCNVCHLKMHTVQTREYRSPRKRNSRPPASVILCRVSWVENVLLIYYASSYLFVCLHWKNPRFTAFFDSNFYTWLAIVTENELGLAFPPTNLPKKFRPDPSTFYLVIVYEPSICWWHHPVGHFGGRTTGAGRSPRPCQPQI